MSTTDVENALSDEILNSWDTPNTLRIKNFMAGVALQRLEELDEVEL